MNPATFDREIITEMVEGAFVDVIIQGDPSLEDACLEAARRLVDRGADVICADCGFLIRHQAAVSAAVNVPVALSSLLLVPTLLRQLPTAQKLAVITADSRHCTEDMLGIDKLDERSRVVIGGIENGEYVRNQLVRPSVRVSVDQIEREVASCVQQLRDKHPDIAILLFECTGFPVVAAAMRRTTGLPIYDVTDLCRMTLASVTVPIRNEHRRGL
ncbi:hypothetical protein GGD56_007041 [Rhizobium mongolense]|uniref:Asp/Glu/hydantoin racemase n=1 Tax=Rhizobium mongolense TaxID=57676 RepID=A0ABR6IZ01_9HYPH|nr:hypothetical protein [Rhizobium mongolense]